MIRVLLVDDEPSVLRSTSLLLADFGFDVTSVSQATQIISELRRVLPDVLVQDVRMPGLNVRELVKSIRADAAIAGIPIVLCSASLEVYEIADELGVTVLEKPNRPDVMVSTIERAAASPVASS